MLMRELQGVGDKAPLRLRRYPPHQRLDQRHFLVLQPGKAIGAKLFAASMRRNRIAFNRLWRNSKMEVAASLTLMMPKRADLDFKTGW
jgi:hypothetical protein